MRKIKRQSTTSGRLTHFATFLPTDCAVTYRVMGAGGFYVPQDVDCGDCGVRVAERVRPIEGRRKCGRQCRFKAGWFTTEGGNYRAGDADIGDRCAEASRARDPRWQAALAGAFRRGRL